jgi:hypothetical protein
MRLDNIDYKVSSDTDSDNMKFEISFNYDKIIKIIDTIEKHEKIIFSYRNLEDDNAELIAICNFLLAFGIIEYSEFTGEEISYKSLSHDRVTQIRRTRKLSLM